MADTILIVDDNEMNRDMLSRRLSRQGFTVEMAEHGQMALDMLRQQPYALLLLDVMMPRMNGYEVLATVKADPELRHVPVIMISAVDDLESVVRCIELGADDYLFKPFNPILLKARVQASLRRGSAPGGIAPASLTPIEERLTAVVARLEAQGTGGDELAQLQAALTDLRGLIGK